MTSVPKKNKTARGKARSKQGDNQSREVDPNEVFQNFLHLFEHLGIDVAQHADAEKFSEGSAGGSHTLYPHASAIGELFTAWHQKPAYVNEQGRPAKIPLRGPSPSLRHLAQRMVPSVDESFLISELERLGAITIDGGSHARLNMRSFPVYEDKRLAAQHTLSILNAFLTTLCHNLDSTASNSDQLFHRIAWNNNFDPKELPALKVRVKRHGQNFLESFDDWMSGKMKSKSRKTTRSSTRAQVSIGLYVSIESIRSLRRRP